MYDEHDTDPTSPFHDTPATTHLDAQGRVYRSTETPDGLTEHVTHLTLDVQGNVLQVTDARGNATQVQTFDLVGRPLFTGAADEGYDGVSGRGETRILVDVAGQPLRVWRSGNLSLRTAYDALRRPVGTWVDEGAGERRSTRTVYGDALPEPPPFAKGRPVQVDDPAGRVTLGHDFRGRTVSQTRQVLADITVDADWDADPALDPEPFSVTTGHDALDRVTSEVSPDGSSTTRTYDEGGRLVTVAVGVRGDAATSFVDHIAYDARGQRLAITYGNGTATTYTYDPFRFWLTRLHTLRGATALQDLQYTHDAVGNIVEIRDDAQQTEFFANAQVTPTRTFAYDALYRLVQATGREKVDQRQTTAFYADCAGATGSIPDPGDPALRQYTQSYRYDAVGNLLEMKHQQGLGGAVAWRRGYAYEPGNNQLVSTSAPGDDPDDPSTHTDRYPYNERGAMTAMPHLPALVRADQDQLRRADLDLAGSVAWYAYDAGGQRVRKRVDKGGVQEERIYVGGYEVWRKRTASGLQEERQTLHVMGDQRRIALVETLTVTNGAAIGNPPPRQRYQLDDHLGTATLEVDELGALISYEEYHPYGSTSWWASASVTDVSQKRYRYTGKERDEETGLAYHGARFYAMWLGRWDRPDPAGMVDGRNRYGYCRGNAVGGRDPTGMRTEDGLDPDMDADEEIAPPPPTRNVAEWPVFPNMFDYFPSLLPPGESPRTIEMHLDPFGIAARVSQPFATAASMSGHNDPHHDEKFAFVAFSFAADTEYMGYGVSAGQRLFNATSATFFGRSAFLSGAAKASQGAPLAMEEVLGRLQGLTHTAESQAVMDAISSGRLRLVLDATLDVSGTAGSADSILVNNAMLLDDVVTTVIHEGKHALDMAAGTVPAPGMASLQEVALAELRAFTAEMEFAVANNLTTTRAYMNSGALGNPRLLAISIADAYPALKNITDSDLWKAVERFVNGR
ncbi:MAG: RHS repeat-associated core domain-containing protein [Myxococcota bacterium]